MDVSSQLVGQDGAQEDIDDLLVQSTEDSKHLKHQQANGNTGLNVVVTN